MSSPDAPLDRVLCLGRPLHHILERARNGANRNGDGSIGLRERRGEAVIVPFSQKAIVLVRESP